MFMNNYNPLLMIDFYKATHAAQYPKGMTKIASPYTPRMSRLKDCDHVTFFGLQAFLKDYLIDGFNNNFFNRPEEEVVKEYNRVLTATLGEGTYSPENIIKLHRLGYLPIEVLAVPEGTRTKVGVPQSVFTNTHPDFAWLTNTLETMYSSYMWHIQVSAEVGVRYREIVQEYVDKTCEEGTRVARMLGDFSMRGQHSPESAMKSSAGWLLSFLNTATVPAIMWMEDHYNCDITKEEVGYGAISTEHSVMCSNYAVDGNEETQIKRLLTEIYPHNSFSMVSDSYDYWNLVDNILPKCHKEIMNHDGTLLIRGDSGDTVEIIAGKDIVILNDKEYSFFTDYPNDWMNDYCFNNNIEKNTTLYLNYKDKYFEVFCKPFEVYDCSFSTIIGYEYDIEEIEPTSEVMGTVWSLDQQFGHTTNSKGYKVLDSHVKAIYGDSITPQCCEEIYRRLEAKGYAANNVVLGVGSFSFMCLEENGKFNPYTRDTFGIAIKATYGEDKDGKPVMIHKEPKALSWKKSQKGCCIVSPDGESYTDGHTWEEAVSDKTNLLKPVFKNGKILVEQTLSEIRNRLYPEGF